MSKNNESTTWRRQTPRLDGKNFSEYLEWLLTDAGVETRRFKAGETIFNEGEVGDCAYFIGKGTVRIGNKSPSGDSRTLALLGQGEVFGEMAILDEAHRSASAIAADDCTLFVLPRDKVLELLHNVPQVALWMLNVMVGRLRRMDRAVGQMEKVHEVNLKILAGQEAERKRVGRDLHDGPAQCFADYIMRIQIIERLLDRNMEQAREELALLRNSLKEGLDKIRELIYNLHPKELVQSGLVGAIEKFMSRLAHNAGFEVRLEHSNIPEHLPAALEASLYCIVQEALNNARKYAKAGLLTVTLDYDAGSESLMLVIKDDGVGFDLDELMERYSGMEHYGLGSMDERIKLAGGTMRLQSAPGAGTTLTFNVPVMQKEGEHGEDL